MKFLSVVLLIACVIYGYFNIPPYLQKRHDHYWAAPLAAHLEKQTKGVLRTGKPNEPDEANFFWILFYLNKAEVAGEDLSNLVGNASTEAELGDSLTSLIKDTLLANYAAAKKMRLFEDTTNVVKLEQGEPALVKLAGWEEMKVAVGQVISPSLAPEAANSLPNLLIMPTLVRDAQNDLVTAALLERANTFESAGVIKRESVERIKALKADEPKR